MTRLLVSVRNAIEAEAALAGGAHIVDVKEPSRGPLGAADGAVMDEIMFAVAGRVPVSLACGELARDGAAHVSHTATWAKIGLLDADSTWSHHWLRWRQQLPISCGAVLVAYADAGPSIAAVMAFASTSQPAAFLIDTANKDGRNLFDLLSPVALHEIIDGIHALEIPIALAGSLDSAAIERLLPLGPDIIAVRGAACEGGRGGLVSVERVRGLARLVATADLR